MYKVTAIAPTSYQLNSVSKFGSPVIPNPDGSHTFSAEFDTEDEAKQYLMNRAERYFEDIEELENAINDIKKYGTLRIDAVAGSIEKVEL